ncbi:MAG: ATP-binding protein [Nannocystaceae bacterium]
MDECFPALDVVPVGICVVDRRLDVVFWNRCLERWTGALREAVVGRCIGDLFPKLAEPRYVTRVMSVFESGAPVIFSSQLHKWVFPVTCRDGSMQRQHCIVNIIDEPGADRDHAMIVVQDVTDQSRLLVSYREMRDQALRELASRKVAEEKTIEYTERLEEANGELELFAQVAAHDLRAPLRRIRALGDLIELDGEACEVTRVHLRLMKSSVVRMDALVRDLHVYSRAMTQKVVFGEVEVLAAVQDALTDLSALIEQGGGQIRVDPSIGELPRVYGNPDQLRQVFQNLVGNALKYQRDGVPPHVGIAGEIVEHPTASGGPNVLKIHVRDNGIGIEEQYFARIFEPFRRLHGPGSYDGSGIGLALCAKICGRHGGRIDVSSEGGDGSTFTVTLPVRAAAAA